MTNRSEQDFYSAVAKVAAERNLTEPQRWTIEGYCSENGSDCGTRQWDVAISTLEDLIDQGELMNVATNGERGPFTMNRPHKFYIA